MPRLSPGLLALLFGAGLAARLAFLGIGLSPLLPDSYSYWDPAVSLTQGTGYSQGGQPTAFRPPTYPLFLAAIISFTGPSLRRVLLVQALVVSCLGPGLAWWLRRHGFPSVAAAGTGFLVALDPFLVAASGFILTEALGAVLLLGMVMALQSALSHPSWGRWTLVGLLAGAVGLNTPNTLVLLPFLFFWLALWRPPSLRTILHWGIAGVLVLACIGAWAGRNQIVLGKTIPVRSTGFAWLV